MPDSFFDFGWLERLRHREIFAYWIHLAESQHSPPIPLLVPRPGRNPAEIRNHPAKTDSHNDRPGAVEFNGRLLFGVIKGGN